MALSLSLVGGVPKDLAASVAVVVEHNEKSRTQKPPEESAMSVKEPLPGSKLCKPRLRLRKPHLKTWSPNPQTPKPEQKEPPKPSTLNPQASTLNPKPSTLNPKP